MNFEPELEKFQYFLSYFHNNLFLFSTKLTESQYFAYFQNFSFLKLKITWEDKKGVKNTEL